MAFHEKDTSAPQGSGYKYLRLVEGIICEKSDTPKEGFEEYNTKNPQTDAPVKYYVKRFLGGVEGRITELERVEIEGSNIFGYNLHMEDEDGEFSIFFRDDKTTTERLLKMFESIDLSKDVLVKGWKDENSRPAITMYQDGKNVPQRWNKDNLPQPKKVKGKWNYSAVSEFLYTNTIDKILPQFEEVRKARLERIEAAKEKAAAAAAATGAETSVNTETEEEIPF